GTADMSFDAFGTTGGAGALAGVADMHFDATGTLSGPGLMTGVADMVIDAFGTLSGTTPEPRPLVSAILPLSIPEFGGVGETVTNTGWDARIDAAWYVDFDELPSPV